MSLFFSGKDRTYLLACFDTAEKEPCKVCPLSAYRSLRLSKGSSLPDLPSGVNERIIRSLEKLFDEGGFPPNDGDEGGGGGGGGNERFKLLDATQYCNMLDNFANGAAVRRSERLARHS